MDEDAIAFYLRMAVRLRREDSHRTADRCAQVARMLSWVPKPEQPNPMYRPVGWSDGMVTDSDLPWRDG